LDFKNLLTPARNLPWFFPVVLCILLRTVETSKNFRRSLFKKWLKFFPPSNESPDLQRTAEKKKIQKRAGFRFLWLCHTLNKISCGFATPLDSYVLPE